MKAVIWTKYGPPEGLQLRDVPMPVPKDDEVRIRVHAATVTAGDCEVRSLRLSPMIVLPMRIFMGIRRPSRITILGQELAGEVEAVGKDVTRFKPGDAVFGATGLRLGGYGEYACLPERAVLALKPDNITFEEAATIPTGGMEALHFMRLGKVGNGQHVLINGAGGSIGTYGIQLAKHFGARVTAVDSTAKLDLLRRAGADHVIDYTREDFTRSGDTYDVVFDVIGKSPFGPTVRALTPTGYYLVANPTLSKAVRGRWVAARSDKKVLLKTADQRTEDLQFLAGLVESGVLKSFIDRRYPLAQTADAHRYVESGQKQGHVVISVSNNAADV